MPTPASSSESHDSALLQRIARQDRRALEELYHAYYRRLSRFLQRLAPRYQFAEEVINDTFWVVWTRAGGISWRGACVDLDHGHCLSACAACPAR